MSARPEIVIAAARGWLGTPYHDQASLKGVGTDCLGLLRGVWREVVGEEPMPVPPYTRSWGEIAPRDRLIEAAEACMHRAPLQPGAVLIFRMRPRAVAKHCGIMVEGDRFIHAREGLGVIEEALSGPWRRRIAATFVYPEGR
ncbi:MAG: NlpC/P60 family protein [Paracoccaceae bacterium]